MPERYTELTVFSFFFAKWKRNCVRWYQDWFFYICI